jgi:hypothetical protein
MRMTMRRSARARDVPRSAAIRAAVAGVVSCIVVSVAAAPDKAAPAGGRHEPAARRATRAPAPPRRPSPPRQQDIARPPAPPTPELPPLDTSAPPPSLPRASRERMKLCAMRWLKLRQERQTSGTTWREFATECLTR